MLNTESGSYDFRIDTAAAQPSPLAWPALTAAGTVLPRIVLLVQGAVDVQAQALDHSGRSDPARFCDVDYDDFATDPLGTVAAVYAHFGLDLSGRAADAMRAVRTPRAGRDATPRHEYALADFGLTGDQVDERFAGSGERTGKNA